MKCSNFAFFVVTEMPRIEMEFEFGIVVCFGIRLAPYAFFLLGCTFNTLYDLLKVIVL